MASPDTAVRRLEASAYTIPTDAPESDGTFEWDSTTIVVAVAHADGAVGLGYTYTDAAAVGLINNTLREHVVGSDALDPAATWMRLGRAVRNVGRPGLGMCAVAAVDIALWDLKARLFDRPLVDVLPSAHQRVPIYGSGGFTSYSDEQLHEQLAGWVDDGITRVKIKVSRDPGADPARLDTARKAVGDDTELFVDANGALDVTAAVDWANRFRHGWGVSWFEEPVSSADFAGLRFVREHAPPGIAIAAGEYAYVLTDFQNLIAASAIDCLQADVTRCGGITGLLYVGGLAAGQHIDVSGHCAPNISAHALCAVPTVRHLEYFHDHVRVESMLFDGALTPIDGELEPDRSRPGHGLELRHADATAYRAA